LSSDVVSLSEGGWSAPWFAAAPEAPAALSVFDASAALAEVSDDLEEAGAFEFPLVADGLDDFGVPDAPDAPAPFPELSESLIAARNAPSNAPPSAGAALLAG
jgi:hypothetical protein